MKRITRLTERDLSRIVRRVIKEEEEDMGFEIPNFPEDLIKLFQFFITEFHPDVDLGSSGPNNDGIDGVMGEKTYEASLDYSDEFIDYMNDMASLGSDFQKKIKEVENIIDQQESENFWAYSNSGV
jgi:hypothetical protein